MKLQLQRHLGERSPSLDAGFNQNTTNYVCSPYERNCKLCSRVSATRGVVGSYPIARMAASEQEGWLTWLRTEDGEDDARGLVIGTADAEEASCPVGGFEIKRERERNLRWFLSLTTQTACVEEKWPGGKWHEGSFEHWLREDSIVFFRNYFNFTNLLLLHIFHT